MLPQGWGSLGLSATRDRADGHLCLRGRDLILVNSTGRFLCAGSSVLGEMLQVRGSVASFPPVQGSLMSKTVLEGRGSSYLHQPELCSLSHQCLAARGGKGGLSSTAATGRPGIAPHGRTALMQHTHMRTHSQTHISHPWDQGVHVQTFSRKRYETAQSSEDLQGLFGLS